MASASSLRKCQAGSLSHVAVTSMLSLDEALNRVSRFVETTAVVHEPPLAPPEYRGGMNMPAPPEYRRGMNMPAPP